MYLKQAIQDEDKELELIYIAKIDAFMEVLRYIRIIEPLDNGSEESLATARSNTYERIKFFTIEQIDEEDYYEN
jgi:hypothetical protein